MSNILRAYWPYGSPNLIRKKPPLGWIWIWLMNVAARRDRRSL